jgi:nitric oxide reductase subunit B
MKSAKKLWIAFTLVMGISFAVLIYYGYEIYQRAPPVPEKVVTTNGEVLFSGQDIKAGQNVWQSMCGQEVGTVWGQGAYLAPDWTADWLHREADFILNKYSTADFNQTFDKINSEQKAALEQRLQNELRKNTFNPQIQKLTVSPLRKEAIDHLSNYSRHCLPMLPI